MVDNFSNHDDVYSTAQKVMREVGEVHILVNNAGVVTGRKLLDCPDHEIEKTFDVNLLAQFWVKLENFHLVQNELAWLI